MSGHGIAIVAAGLLVGAASVGQSSLIDRAGWLAGCWEQREGGRVTLEMWMPPAGGMMLGASRTLRDGVVREYEQVRLTTEGDRLVYNANPSGQAAAAFRSEEITDSGFTVANRAHDFPQRIGYRRRGADSLVAWIEGPTAGGTTRTSSPMRRVRCELAAH